MKTSLLCETLGALTKEEYLQLGAMLESPLFNSSRHAALCTSLHRFLGQEGFEKDIPPEQAFHAIYPGRPFNQHLLDNVMSSLMEVTRHFIAYAHWQRTVGETGKRLALAQFYRERRLDQRFLQTIDHERREREKNREPLSADRLFQQFLLEKEVYDFEAVLNNLQGDLNLPAVVDRFMQYYLAQGLELALRLQHQAALGSFDTSGFEAFFRHIRSQAKDKAYFQNPLPELLDKAIPLTELEASGEDFENFLALHDSQAHRLSSAINNLLATMARYFCTAQINLGKRNFRPVLLRLYQTHLAQDLLYENGRIPQSTLFNMVNLAAGEGETVWAETILESHRCRITGSEYPEVVYLFIKATCQFHQKNFDAAGKLLDASFAEMADRESRSHFKDLTLKLMARRLEIQILYEKDPASSLLADRINAHKMFIHRNRHIAAGHRTLHNNFIDLIKQLSAPAAQTDAKRAKKLLDKLAQPGFLIAERRWVTEKVEELARISYGFLNRL